MGDKKMGMTNGEKMQEMFPKGKTRRCRGGVVFKLDGWCHAYDSDWWNAEYKEPTIRNCFGCNYSKDNHNSSTEECHLCMWKNQYTPTTKNDLEVEKAIEIIKADNLAPYSVNEILAARDMAVEALKQMATTKNDLGVEHHKQNIQAYAHDFGVSEEQAETELRVTKNDLGVDAVSRQAVLDLIADYDLSMGQVVRGIHALPSVTPQEPKTDIKLTNSEWIDFLAKQFDISRTSAKAMLHVMMSVKKEDNFKKQFSGRK